MMNAMHLAALAALLLSPPPAPSAVTLEIQSPQPGQTLSAGLFVNLSLIAPASGEYEVEVACFGTTHYLLAAKDHPSRSVDGEGAATWKLLDRWLLPEAGPATLTARVQGLGEVGIGGESRLLAERTIEFRYEPLTGDALDEKLEQQTHYLIGQWMGECDGIEPGKEPYGFDRKDPQSRLAQAKLYFESRQDWLMGRLIAYALLADVYENALQPGDALRALRYAGEVWAAESGEVIDRPPFPPTPLLWRHDHWTTAPAHLNRLADFYARRDDLDRAVHQAEQIIAYYADQVRRHQKLDAWHRDRCNESAAWTMSTIAQWHYLLRRDREGYDRWMAKHAATKPAPAGGRGLLGQDR